MSEEKIEYKVEPEVIDSGKSLGPTVIGADSAMTPSSPMTMMIQAKQAGFSTDEIKEMMDLQDRNDERTAKQAFDKAMAEFKRDPPRVQKDKKNKQYDSSYTSIGNMVNTVNEFLGKFGLSARWDYPDPSAPNMVKVTCILAHELGHTEKVTIEGPIDEGGQKNPIQQRKSARTYLKLETYEAVTGVASDDGNLDDDGNSASEPVADPITPEQVATIKKAITDNELNFELFEKWLLSAIGAPTIEELLPHNFARVMDQIDRTVKAKEAKSES